MSSKIMPITKATKSIQPPLKKSELVEALAIRELENIKKEQEEIANEIATTNTALYNPALVDKIRQDGKVDDNRSDPFHIVVEYQDGKREAGSLRISLDLPASAEVRKLYRKLRDLESRKLRELPSLYQIKQGISAKLSERASAGQRVTALLKNPETSKALDETLAALKQPIQLTISS